MVLFLLIPKSVQRQLIQPHSFRRNTLLHQSDYPEFLKYDSYVDCGMLFSIPLKKLLDGEYFGTLTDIDLQGIFEILKTTETLTNKEKKRFGII